MSVNIKMNHYDLCVSVQLSTSDDYEVNTNGFLSTLEDFLSKLEFYENVDIEIKREAVPVSYTQEPELTGSDWPFTGATNTVTIPSSSGGTVTLDLGANMNRG